MVDLITVKRNGMLKWRDHQVVLLHEKAYGTEGGFGGSVFFVSWSVSSWLHKSIQLIKKKSYKFKMHALFSVCTLYFRKNIKTVQNIM